ncbi:2-phosphosulfolactate phosphatase [Saccharopolyspora lacisalsi]|uniref:Probable 2-phosphosulfolactate phosphatase n=1 Tax=Halosaccharopolyspora lacisalsi TaxID=1000566 RepID=A0A839E353_9PSEU|nr:2-phosphosulfolactate phosphatase [Halosaccharopolyspora lacisalsi]MBA8825348.1 2-phosphosulfolactate phosphatase [Halosaccharopolyspora lacisalsi]
MTAQHPHGVRFDWGIDGMRNLATECPVVVVVDVLSFSTCVDVAIEAGARVLPLRWHDARGRRAAEEAGAVMAGPRGTAGWSLSPSSLRGLHAGVLLALPSPNGATLCAEAADLGATVFTGCLRNTTAIAHSAAHATDGEPIGVVAAGERWNGGALRPAVEDLLGAGAITAELRKHAVTCSSEADLAAVTYRAAAHRLGALITDGASGRELSARGFAHDVELACDTNTSSVAPRLRNGVFEEG